MAIRSAVIASCLLWLAAGAAQAEAVPPDRTPASTDAASTVAPVTVRAPALTRPEAARKSEAFVEAYATPTAVLGQYARWRGPLCIQIFDDVAPAEAMAITSRIAQVANAVGLKLLAPGCRPNIQIVFTAHPQAVLDSVAKRNEALLGYHYPSQTKALKTVTRPVQAWYATATMGGGANNAELAFMSVENPFAAPGVKGDKGTTGNPKAVNMGMVSLDVAGAQAPGGCGDSHFSTCRSSVFVNVMVVVDNRRLQGKTLGPLSDYLAMLALSQPRSLDGCLDLPSVIDLFAPRACSGRAEPDGLTTADAAYLTALYATDPEAKKADADMAARMAEILVDPGQVVLTALGGAETSASRTSSR